LFIVVFTRILGPVELGRYFLVVSVVTFSAVVLGTWFQQALLRFDSGAARQRSPERAAFYLFFLVLSLATTALGWLAYAGLRAAALGFPSAAVRLAGTARREWRGYFAELRRFAGYGLPMLAFMLASEGRPLLDRTLITLFDSAFGVGVFASNYALGSSTVGLL